jgi:hypothetical protein
MINDGINDVPDKTIVLFTDPYDKDPLLNKERVSKIVTKANKKRDWFDPHFYRCLPLTIGNQYGFTIALEFDFSFEWNGGNDVDDVQLFFDKDIEGKIKTLYPQISTHFGSGILTINPPFFLRTPNGVNLMTINPPNMILPNITVMTGVVETDNLRRNFTFNLKIQMPGIRVKVPAGTPIAGFIPVPRYFCDSFDIKFAEEIFENNIINEELEASRQAGLYRERVEPVLKNNVSKHYFLGQDVYGNKFKDHQRP